MSSAVDIFDLVFIEVLLVDVVQMSNVIVPLCLEDCHVKSFGMLDGEAVGSGIVDVFGNGGSVPSHLLRDTACRY